MRWGKADTTVPPAGDGAGCSRTALQQATGCNRVWTIFVSVVLAEGLFWRTVAR